MYLFLFRAENICMSLLYVTCRIVDPDICSVYDGNKVSLLVFFEEKRRCFSLHISSRKYIRDLNYANTDKDGRKAKASY